MDLDVGFGIGIRGEFMRHENVRKGGMHAAVHPRQCGERATTGGLCLWQDARFGELFIKVQNDGDDLIDHAVIIDQHRHLATRIDG